MEVTTDVITLDRRQCLITNNGPDDLLVGEIGTDVATWYTVVMGDSITISDRFNNATGVVSDGVSDVGLLYGGTGVFPPAVEAADLSGFETTSAHNSSQSAAIAALSTVYQPLDSDLTSIAALSTTSYGRALLTLANAAASDWATDSEVASSIAAAVAAYQPLDSDLTAIAALSTTSFGRALLALADAAALGAYIGAAVYGQPQGVNAQTGTTYTLVAADAGKRVTLSNAAAITLTLPQDSDATIALGTYVDLIQLGAGQVTVVAGSGATLRTSGLTAKCRAQYSRVGVQKILANTWSLFGDLAAT